MATTKGASRTPLAGRLIGGWMRLCGHRPRTALSAMSILIVLALLVLPRLGVDADSSKMLSASLPAQERSAELSEAFPNLKRAIVIVVRGTQADAADLAVRHIVNALGAGSGWVEDAYAPSVDPYMSAHGILYRDVGEVEDAFSRLSKSSNLIARLRSDQTLEGFAASLDEATALAARAEMGPGALDRLYEETAAVFEAEAEGESRGFGWSALLEAETPGTAATRLITVTPVLDTARLSPAKPALEQIDAAVGSLPPEIAKDVTVGITGEPALRADEMESVLSTIGLSGALSLLLVGVILLFGLRSRARAGLAFASLLICIVLTAGFAAVAVGTLNLVSVAFVVLMVGLGVDFAIHILAHIAETRRQGVAPGEAVYLTGTRTGLALALNATTAALAFLAFTTTDFTGMAQLGLIGSGGVIIALAVAATLIPATIALAPWVAGSVAPRTEPIGRAARRWRALPYIMLALGAAAIWPALQVRFDADPMALRDPESPSVVAFGILAEEARTSPYRASVLVESAEEAAAVAERFEGVAGVSAAVTLMDLVPEDQDEKLMLLDFAAPSIEHAIEGEPTQLLDASGDRGPALERLQNRLSGLSGAGARLAGVLAEYRSRRSAASDAALERDLYRTFPLMTDRLEAMLSADYVTVESLPEELRERFLAPGGTWRVEILPEEDLDDPEAVERFVETVEALAPEATGGPIQLVAAGRTVGMAMLQATLLAALATGVLAWLATRRVADTLAVLLPLVVAGVLTAAASVLMNMPFNYANVIVLPMMLGLGVASGVHIALRERRAPGAVFATSTPRAVVFSALTTIAAFATLALSDHPGTASMGVLLSVAVLAAVAAVLSLTPAIIRWSDRLQISRNQPTDRRDSPVA